MAQEYTEPPLFNVESLTEGGDKVIAIGQITFKGITSAYCDVWTVNDGKLAQLRAFVIPEK